MTKQADLELESLTRFKTPHLEIAPALLGQSHVFTFQECEIAIRLPTKESLPEYDRPGRWVKGERLSLSTWNMKSGEFLWVIVHDADAVVSIPGRISIPEVTRGILIRHDLYSEEQGKHLDKLADHYGELAHRGFDLWIRTLRWMADDFRIATPGLSGLSVTGWQNEIWEKDQPNRNWEGTQSITVHGGKPVTVEIWNKVAAALEAGYSPPIYYDLLSSARADLDTSPLENIHRSATSPPFDLHFSLQEEKGRGP